MASTEVLCNVVKLLQDFVSTIFKGGTICSNFFEFLHRRRICVALYISKQLSLTQSRFFARGLVLLAIIALLLAIYTSYQHIVLVFNGIKGEAWVVTYACSVLGLNTCVVDKDGNVVPIAGKYEDAKVVINLGSSEHDCQLYLAGVTTDHLISFQAPEQFSRRGWSIDCSLVNFVDLQHPGLRNSDSFSRLSNFVAMETLGAVTAWAESFTRSSVVISSPKIDTGFKSYTMSVLSILQERSLNILGQFGFRPSKLSSYIFEGGFGCATHTQSGMNLIQYRAFDSGNLWVSRLDLRLHLDKRLNIVPGLNISLRNLSFRLPNVAPSSGEFVDSEQRKSATSTNYSDSFLELNSPLQSAISSTISHAINFASKLSFSNWNTTFGTMSVRAMSPTAQNARSEETTFEGPMSEAISLCVDGINIIDLETRLWSQDWLALDLDGVVVSREVSRHYSIHGLNGKYLSFNPGSLRYEGLLCSKIRTDRTDIRYRDTDASYSTRSTRFEQICAWAPRELCSRQGDTIFVRLEIMMCSNSYIIVDSSRPATILPEVLVTDQCPHGFNKDELYKGRIASDIDLSSFGMGNDVAEGISFGGQNLNSIVFYQHTENIPLGQWLACHWKAQGVIILQNGCCLRYLFRRFQRVSFDPKGFPYPICIIAGGQGRQLLEIPHRERQSRRSADADPQNCRGSSDSSITSPPSPRDMVKVLDVFFAKSWVLEFLSKLAFEFRKPYSSDRNVLSHLIVEKHYREVQAAFVTEALGDDPSLLFKIREDLHFESLRQDWNVLRDWLLAQDDTVDIFDCIHLAIIALENLVASQPSEEKRKPWHRLFS
ncbi:hypothetical protein VTL71DRAFT_7997 [Oculimacula yallundae]|uniref:Uncharacterized protein n=1 Tax=Oculimacula yallundae TaxID=86028 RepID=A0ABR4CWC1_9HELO